MMLGQVNIKLTSCVKPLLAKTQTVTVNIPCCNDSSQHAV